MGIQDTEAGRSEIFLDYHWIIIILKIGMLWQSREFITSPKFSYPGCVKFVCHHIYHHIFQIFSHPFFPTYFPDLLPSILFFPTYFPDLLPSILFFQLISQIPSHCSIFFPNYFPILLLLTVIEASDWYNSCIFISPSFGYDGVIEFFDPISGRSGICRLGLSIGILSGGVWPQGSWDALWDAGAGDQHLV